MSIKNHKIDAVESTTSLLNGRAGLSAFCRYVGNSGVLNRLEKSFGSLRKNSKGLSIRQFFYQTMAWFADGTSRHINYFDELKQDESYGALIEVAHDDLASQDAIKRLFKVFRKGNEKAFRDILLEVFIERLRVECPKVISLTLDSMVMDNNEADVRNGVEPTYKKVKGFHPVQMIWNGMVIDGIFRSGKRNTNESSKTLKMLRRVIDVIRERYDENAFIIIRLDSGYYDQKVVALLDQLKVGFVLTGKVYSSLKEKVETAPLEAWNTYCEKHQAWDFTEFKYKSDSWNKEYRTIYTQPHYNEDGEIILEFARPANVIMTNIHQGASFLDGLTLSQRRHWMKPSTIIKEHHRRGGDELPHRSLKDFGFEELPFKSFHANMAIYQTMLLAFALFECFKRDVLFDIIPVTCYATTVRRKVFDIACKIVRHAEKITMKIHDAVMRCIRFALIWERSCQIHRFIE